MEVIHSSRGVLSLTALPDRNLRGRFVTNALALLLSDTAIKQDDNA